MYVLYIHTLIEYKCIDAHICIPFVDLLFIIYWNKLTNGGGKIMQVGSNFEHNLNLHISKALKYIVLLSLDAFK